MSNLITLTASMRSNLMSLKNIATQMNKTQNILSTGKKVNSAIDNASSYYQARSLTNRANDLNSLLDSMSQGIQTIQAATQGLESATSYLTQAKAVLEEAAINQKFVSSTKNKEWLEQQDAVFTFTNRKGDVISSVVTNKEDLLDAVASGKAGDIIVFGEIDMGADKIVLNDNQSLVGVDKYSAGAKTQYSKLTFDVVGNAIEVGNNSTIGWLDIEGTTTIPSNDKHTALIIVTDKTGIKLHDLDINHEGVGGTLDGYLKSTPTIHVISGKVDVYGKLNIKNTSQTRGYCIAARENSEINFYDAEVNIRTTGTHSFSVSYASNSKINLYGKTKFYSSQVCPINILRGLTNSTDDTCFNILSSEVTVWLKSQSNVFSAGDRDSFISVVKGAKLYVNNTLYTATKDENGILIKTGSNPNVTTNGKNNVFSSRAVTTEESEEFNKAMNKVLADDFPKNENENDVEETEALDNSTYLNQYTNILTQFDNLLIDSSYQGVNLLTGGNLEVTFNESRTHELKVVGKDMRADKIGLKTKDWRTNKDIEKSVQEIINAMNEIRSFSAELGNNYAIIQTRQNFTDALCSVLQTGADNLVLADMNEASAEYLMLQTRQQLAINSLSLASQSAQSILSLF